MDTHLRPARTEDLEAMDRIANRSGTDWNREHFARFLKDSLAKAIVGELRQLRSSGQSIVKTVVGYCLYVDRRTHWYICELVVDPDNRRQGHAWHMLESMASLLDDQHRFLSLDAKASNPVALTLYTKFGFTKVGVVKHLYGPDGDAVRMVYRQPEEVMQ